jgi:hypothetical protein
MPRTFLHVSDMHIRERDILSPIDPDADLRNELLRDLATLRGEYDFDGVLVSGDLAFAGQPKEYAAVSMFLREITDAIGLEPSAVWVVPGNHDVDRGRQKTIASLLHSRIRNAAAEGSANLEQVLRELLDEEDMSPLLSPLDAYNAFADQYGCRSELGKLAWRQDFSLGDGWVLRVHGLNSALVSGASDNENEGKLVLGGCVVTPLHDA